MRKLCMVIPVWGREWLTNHLLNYYYQFNDSQTEYIIVVVGSEGIKSKKLARGIEYLETDNNPLDKKYDKGFQYCRQFNPDAVTLIGSDDFITQNYFEWSLDEIEHGADYAGLLDFYLTDIKSNQIHYWKGYGGERGGDTVGAGRVFLYID